MLSLLQIQKSFYNSLFHNEEVTFICSEDPQERFDVYRKTIFENMLHALKTTFPGVWELLGESCANQAAFSYCRLFENLPKTGCLDDFGEQFPAFLETLSPLQTLPYLKAYASYEWLKHLAYHAKEAKSLSPSDLKKVPQEKIENMIFHFIPSFFLCQSEYPLFDIQEVIQKNTDLITLSKKQTYILIVRIQDEVVTYWISESQGLFFTHLSQGTTLSKALELATAFDTAFDLTAALVFMLQAKLVSHFSY